MLHHAMLNKARKQQLIDPFSFPLRKLTIRLAIVGTDASVTNAVASYAALRLNASAQFEHADFVFYVLPVSDLQTPRTIAVAMSDFDVTWGRNVYNLFGASLRMYGSLQLIDL